MSFLMDHDDWLLSGSQLAFNYDPFSYTTFSSWEENDAPVSSQINERATGYSSTTVFDAMEYNMEVDSISLGKSSFVEDNGMMSFDQFCPGALSRSPELEHVTDAQLRKYVVHLEQVPDGVQLADNNSLMTSAVIATGHQMIPGVPLEWKKYQPLSVGTPNHEVLTFPGGSVGVATVPDCEADAEDVMDLLNQLSDTMDSDMYIDQAELEALVSLPLDPITPDDVESLISSSQLSPVHTHITDVASSSFCDTETALAVPQALSPAASEGSVELGSTWNQPVTEKKRKKQDQNKSAALRYRQKKRSEHGTVMSEYEELERRNSELKTKVAEMTKEVDYLKGLIEEICSP